MGGAASLWTVVLCQARSSAASRGRRVNGVGGRHSCLFRVAGGRASASLLNSASAALSLRWTGEETVVGEPWLARPLSCPPRKLPCGRWRAYMKTRTLKVGSASAGICAAITAAVHVIQLILSATVALVQRRASLASVRHKNQLWLWERRARTGARPRSAAKWRPRSASTTPWTRGTTRPP